MRTIVAAVVLAGCATASAVVGDKPAYLDAVTTGVPNEAALGRRIFTPGLEEGWVPQGLTVAGGDVLVAAYRSAEPKVNTGPCRVFRIEAATGRVTGHFDLVPANACGHAGGLAWMGNGMLLVADTRTLFRVDLAKALATGTTEGATRGVVKITGELRGSYAAHDGRDAWIGTWTKDAAKSRMYRLDPELFDKYDGQTVDEKRAVESIPVPLEAQGAAFDGKGQVWVTASASSWAKLYRLDRQGRVLATHEMVPGLEDIEFDASGRLWGVSESGTRKYLHWRTRFPFVFEIDVARLQ